MSGSLYLGKHHGDPLMHLAKPDGLNESQLTSGVLPESLFHTDLPYMFSRLYEYPVVQSGTVEYLMMNRPGNRQFNYSFPEKKKYTLQLPNALREELNQFAFLVGVKLSNGQQRLLPNMMLSFYCQREAGVWNSRIYSGDYCDWLFHTGGNPLLQTQTSFTGFMRPNLRDDYPNDIPCGYHDRQTHISVLTDGHIAVTDIFFCILNISYDRYKYNVIDLKGDSNDILLNRDTFRVGDLDLASWGIVADRTDVQKGKEGAYPFYGYPQYTDEAFENSDYGSDWILIRRRSMANMVGGRYASSWEMDFRAGAINATIDKQKTDVFNVTTDVPGMLFNGRTITCRIAQQDIWISGNQTVVRGTLGRFRISDGSPVKFLMMTLPSHRTFIASGFWQSPDHNQNERSFYNFDTGLTVNYACMQAGNRLPVVHSASMQYNTIFLTWDTVNVFLEYDSDGYLSVKFYALSDIYQTNVTWNGHNQRFPDMTFELMFLE
ncbi:hypothetical protein [Endozoicomonas lisbonensis]|uniref:hypothetical protein n=1 Tax=Endozoicomonas lisbonensis TaxID=3120522 RepID=UPI00339B1345